MSARLSFRSRLLTAIGGVLVLGAFFFPLWRIDLSAPQYPEGIGMLIRVNTVTGVKPNDLPNINGLNHYIGMKAIVPDSIPELRYMPWIVGALAASGVLVALWGRRAALVGWLTLFAVTGLAGLADFWRWGYDYGHNLDPHAIIKVPGMVYQPPLIGSRQLLNFTAYSWPDVGGILVGLGFALAAAALFLSYRQSPPARTRVTLMLAALAGVAGCASSGPREIAYGEESCAFCRMKITDPRHGAQVRTAHGRVQAFDAIECAAGFARTLPEGELGGVWVSDHDAPGSFVAAEEASFWRTTGASTPMGSGLVATAGGRPPAGLAVDGGPLRWTDVLALVEHDGPRGAAAMEGSHAPAR